MTPYRKEIELAAKAKQIDPDLLEALVMIESSGEADARRFEPEYFDRYLKNNPDYAGAVPERVAKSYGLCQIMYPTARQYGFRHEPEMLFLPGVNLDLGAKILRALLNKYDGDEGKALQAYNGGPGNVGKARPEAYSKRVLRQLEAIRLERRA
jgi:soluble lytic murein transglycosylase-like protein